jgi:mannose-6-phosphate isomerase
MIYKLLPTRVFRAYHGGRNLDEWENKTDIQSTRFPEDWLASVTVANNPGRDLPTEGLSQTEDSLYLRDIIESDKKRMLGDAEEMSLLFKLLDTDERLVIQGHPTVSFAKEHFNSNFGKTECWYILGDGGYVYLGFREGITKEYWTELFKSQDVDAMLDCLHKFEVQKGQLIFVEGGVPHAIGAGCFLAELQEPTDLMVIPEKVTPAGVVLSDQKLHGGLGFEKMMDCFVYEGADRQETARKYIKSPVTNGERLTAIVDRTITDKFRLYKLDVDGEYHLPMNTYGIILAISGTVQINGVEMQKNDRVFVPFADSDLRISGKGELLISTP